MTQMLYVRFVSYQQTAPMFMSCRMPKRVIRGDVRVTLRHLNAGDEVHVAVALKKGIQGKIIAVITVF